MRLEKSYVFKHGSFFITKTRSANKNFTKICSKLLTEHFFCVILYPNRGFENIHTDIRSRFHNQSALNSFKEG